MLQPAHSFQHQPLNILQFFRQICNCRNLKTEFLKANWLQYELHCIDIKPQDWKRKKNDLVIGGAQLQKQVQLHTCSQGSDMAEMNSLISLLFFQFLLSALGSIFTVSLLLPHKMQGKLFSPTRVLYSLMAYSFEPIYLIALDLKLPEELWDPSRHCRGKLLKQ